MWRRKALDGANYRFVQSLHSGNTMNHLNKWAEKHELEKIDVKKPKTITEPEKKEPTKDTKTSSKLKDMLPKKALDQKIKNPETGRTIKVKSALEYDKDKPVYKAAIKLAKK